MKRCHVLLTVLLLAAATPAGSADYLFSLPQVDCHVTVQRDGSIHIAYDFHFANSFRGRPIDAVDVGFPTTAYRLDSVRAWQDGEPVHDIRRSSTIDIGVEVHLLGDCSGVGYIVGAIMDAARVARAI